MWKHNVTTEPPRRPSQGGKRGALCSFGGAGEASARGSGGVLGTVAGVLSARVSREAPQKMLLAIPHDSRARWRRESLPEVTGPAVLPWPAGTPPPPWRSLPAHVLQLGDGAPRDGLESGPEAGSPRRRRRAPWTRRRSSRAASSSSTMCGMLVVRCSRRPPPVILTALRFSNLLSLARSLASSSCSISSLSSRSLSPSQDSTA